MGPSPILLYGSVLTDLFRDNGKKAAKWSRPFSLK